MCVPLSIYHLFHFFLSFLLVCSGFWVGECEKGADEKQATKHSQQMKQKDIFVRLKGRIQVVVRVLEVMMRIGVFVLCLE